MSWTNDYVGIAYDGPTGFNCYELTRRIMKEQFGVVVPEPDQEISAYTTVESALPIIESAWERVDPEDRQPGDVLFFQGSTLCHCGVVASRNHFIHTSRATGAIVEDLRYSPLKNKLKGVYRPKQ